MRAAEIDVLVVGAGIVGSWVAARSLDRGLSVAICDISERLGDGISGRNSGVLHAGLYYEPGSLKARHCAIGKAIAEEFIERHGLPIVRCGKVVTGRSEDGHRLELLLKQATANGARAIELLSKPGQRFAGVKGDVALWSGGTSVVDAAAYLGRLHLLIEEQGGLLLRGRQFLQAEPIPTGHEATLRDRQGIEESLRSRFIVNCAGLHADEVAQRAGLAQYEIRPVRGEYFRLRYRHPVGILVYPLPSTDTENTALGVHYTFHPSGEAYAGPNAVPADSKSDYRVTATAADFARSLATILDGYSEEDFQPGYAGLRPRLFRDGNPVNDFVIVEHPFSFFHFLGIESPGLTAAPSLATELPFLSP